MQRHRKVGVFQRVKWSSVKVLLTLHVDETIEETSILVAKEGSNINGPLELKATLKNSRGGKFYIYESKMKMAVLPKKSLEHEDVRWFTELPEDTDPRLKDLI